MAGTPLANVANPQIEAMQNELATMKLDLEIERLKMRYPDFNEVEVLKEVDARGIYDLEFVYKAMKNTEPQDLNQIKEQLAKEIRAQLTEEIRQQGIATQTIISASDSVTNANYGLSQDEMKIAGAMGINYKDYAKFK